MTNCSAKLNCFPKAIFLLFLGFMAVAVTSCARRDADTASKLAQIAELPEFATRPASSGSVTGPRHYLYEGEFYIDPAQYRAADGSAVEPEDMLWDIFQRYGERIRKQISLDDIPNMISRGGSSKPETRATHYQFRFDSTGVSIHYDVEWVVRGWTPKDWESKAIEPRPEIRVIYHFRVN